MQVHCMSLPLFVNSDILLLNYSVFELKLNQKLLIGLLNPKPSCFGIQIGSGNRSRQNLT
jgi:hypothetical protein